MKWFWLGRFERRNTYLTRIKQVPSVSTMLFRYLYEPAAGAPFKVTVPNLTTCCDTCKLLVLNFCHNTCSFVGLLMLLFQQVLNAVSVTAEQLQQLAGLCRLCLVYAGCAYVMPGMLQV